MDHVLEICSSITFSEIPLDRMSGIVLHLQPIDLLPQCFRQCIKDVIQIHKPGAPTAISWNLKGVERTCFWWLFGV